MSLDNYESVKVRKKRFLGDYPDGRTDVINIAPENIMEYAYYKAFLYKDAGDQAQGLPLATGTAMEIRDKEMSVNKYGKEYASVNYTSWTENCEESAIGRALDNAGYSGNDKCSREEIVKAQAQEKVIRKKMDDKKTAFNLINKITDSGKDKEAIEEIKVTLNIPEDIKVAKFIDDCESLESAIEVLTKLSKAWARL